MKVVQLVTARQFRGAEIFASQLSQELVAGGNSVLYVSLYKPAGQEYRPAGIDWVDMNANKSGWISISLLFRLRSALKAFGPDIVQANAGDTLKYAVLLKLFFGLRAKIVYRNASIMSDYLGHAAKRWAQGLLLRQVDHVISVTQASRNDLVRLYPFLAGRITVIPIALRLQNLKTKEKPAGLPVQHPLFIHVGGFSFEKNHAGLIRIFEAFYQKYQQGMLWLVGDGKMKSEVEELVRQRGLGQRVIFLGSRDDVQELLPMADCLVLPSIIEGMPAVILEAFYAKTPVVAYQVGGIGEIVEINKTGWLVAKGDEIEFVDAMSKVVFDANSSVIREDAFRDVVARFMMDQCAVNFLRVYTTMISTPKD